jgi:hypothetical protein
LAERGDWVVAYVNTAGPWPVKTQIVSYRGAKIWIIPVMKNFYPALAMRVGDGYSREDAGRLLMRFLSALSWVERRGYLVEGIGGGSSPFPMGRDKERGFSICEEFNLTSLPDPSEEQALLALALMREGRGLNHPAYAFLSFYRILEVAFPNGAAIKAWLGSTVGSLTGFGVAEAMAKLKDDGRDDVPAHLWESGRCAVAHANREPVVDPDDPADARRMRDELPIIRALAEKAIEEKLGVKTPTTIYREHLYELAGFKEVLGVDTVAYLTRGEEIADGRSLEIPDIKVAIRKRSAYAPLCNLSIKEARQEGTMLYLAFGSKVGDVGMRVQLDFAAERLNFSVFDDLAVADTGSAESAERVAEVLRFQFDYFGNGELQIFNADTGALLGRKDAYLPLNMHLNHEGANAEIARWRRLAEERRARGRNFAEEMSRQAVGYKVTINASPTAIEAPQVPDENG